MKKRKLPFFYKTSLLYLIKKHMQKYRVTSLVQKHIKNVEKAILKTIALS